MSEGAKSLTIEKHDQAVVGRIPVKMLDEDDLKTLAGQIDQACAADPNISVVVLDLAQVAMIPSLGLGLLVQIGSKCRVRRQQLKLAALQPQVRKVFSITKLDRIFHFTDSVESAMEGDADGRRPQ